MSGVKCTDRKRASLFSGIILALALLLSGCGDPAYDMAYDADSSVSSFNVISRQDSRVAEPFAANLCVVTGDVEGKNELSLTAEAAMLCDLNRNQVLYSKNPHESLNPASLTKIMTALVAIQNGRLDQVLTATDSVKITERGAQLLGLKAGDTMTLDQALRILLIYSANDVAMLVAEGVAGSVDAFVEMMNQEARQIGATNTHFVNPHGLTAEGHLTTAYDLYLIFNEALKYETFREIIQMSSYQTTYYDAGGNPQTVDKKTTNLFLRGDRSAPSNVTVIGGKTGTTSAAGHCLVLLSRDAAGASYISVILKSDDTLYEEMIKLLEEI